MQLSPHVNEMPEKLDPALEYIPMNNRFAQICKFDTKFLSRAYLTANTTNFRSSRMLL
jgi:hypothetical protein